IATPRPMSATRNCTMKLTSVKVVKPRITRKVARIETAAISSGTRASSEPNTKASTASAPSPPSSVSVSTPVPPPPSLADSSSKPVTRSVAAGDRAPPIAVATAGPRSGPPRPVGGVNTSPKVVRPSAEMKARSPGDRTERPVERRPDAWAVHRGACRQRDDRHQRPGVAAVAVETQDGLVGLVALGPGQREVGCQPAGHRAGGRDADHQDSQPAQPHHQPVAEQEPR